MILILSTDIDTSTYEIMKLLVHKGAEVYRLNDSDILRYPLKLEIDGTIKFEIQINGKWICSEDIDVVWYRKFGFINNYEGFFDFTKSFGKVLFSRVTLEYRKVLNLMMESLAHCEWVNHYKDLSLNKFEVLRDAKMIGLIIPSSIITSSKIALQQSDLKSSKIITKSIGDILFVSSDGEDHEIAVLTTDVTKQVKKFKDNFFPSLFQEKIEKKFELRIFYLDGSFYTMAIFSQGNAQTDTDFRQYDTEKPNRWVPYKLPDAIEEKLHLLMKHLNLQTGSIDMIYSKNDEYVFLEVNPSGQFGMVSSPCNYNLEERIAESLFQRDLQSQTKKSYEVQSA